MTEPKYKEHFIRFSNRTGDWPISADNHRPHWDVVESIRAWKKIVVTENLLIACCDWNYTIDFILIYREPVT